jgi:PAS domain S-box-containing protein
MGRFETGSLNKIISPVGEVMEKKKILIIDDDPNIRKTLTDILELKGFEAFSAESGTEGIKSIGQAPVNLAIIDLGLPDMSGLDILTSVRAGGSATEAIVLTGDSSIDAAIEATNRGAFSFLLKPYDIAQLMLHVRRALEKQDIEESLRNSEARYRMIAENARDLIWTLDDSGRVSYVSPSVERLRGITPEEAMRETLSEAIAPESRKVAMADMEEIFRCVPGGERRETRVHEIEFTREGGGTIWLEVSSAGVYDPSGKFMGILCTGHDISERKAAEEKRNKLIDELRDALDKIKILTGLLPVCAYCKKIRNERDDWEEMEVYIRDRSEADFSHGVCPDCLGRLYQDVNEKNSPF